MLKLLLLNTKVNVSSNNCQVPDSTSHKHEHGGSRSAITNIYFPALCSFEHVLLSAESLPEYFSVETI